MKHVYDDGGRAAAGFKGDAGDCAVRAIAIATGESYLVVYDAINQLATRERTGKRKRGVSNARTGVYKQTMHRYMAAIGWKWTPTMHIGSGCTVHLHDGELPMGRLIVSVSRHYTTVIDGVIHDTHDPTERGTTIYPAHYDGKIPAKARRLSNGSWAYSPERCVYGYWRKQ